MGGQDRVPGNDNVQTPGRKANAAKPLEASANTEGAERYPPERKDDSVEARSFDGEHANPRPPQGAGDGGPAPATNEGRLGPEGDPAEGKR